MADLREALTAAVEQHEAAPVDNTPVESRARDDQGRFAAKEPEGVQPATIPAPAASPAPAPEDPPKIEGLERPTTWKKEYLPLWDKMAQGQPLTQEEARKVLQYANQRETEYKTGVSTYKNEAMQARELQSAMAPFLPELQKYNIQPTQWISNLGNAHKVLALGNPQEKLAMFQQLAKDYGIPMEMLGQAAQGQGPDANTMALLAQVNSLKQQLQEINGWRSSQEQQRAQTAIAEIANDPVNYPHFEKVRETMGQLLDSGLAADLKTAYKQAVRMNDEVFEEEQARLSQAATEASQIASRAAAAAKAKAQVTSVRSATPSTPVSDKPKDRRALLEEEFSKMGRM